MQKFIKLFLWILVFLLNADFWIINSAQAASGAAYLSFLLGPNWVSTGRNTMVTLEDLTTHFYEENSHATVIGPLAGIDIGYLQNLTQHWFVGPGLEWSFTRVVSPVGLVRPLYTINPNFDTLNFTYVLRSIPLFVILRWGWIGPRVEIYSVLGGGASWNRASEYYEVPSNPNDSAVPMRSMFRSRGEANVGYTAGAGFSLLLTASTQIGFEYRYTDYGVAHLAPTAQQVTTQLLSLGETRANAILVTLTVALAK